MRITGGILNSRPLKVPKSGVRPTQDKVRAAVFSSLGDAMVGAGVMDLFAGSGALGLEAWSRGAAFVCWVEKDVKTSSILQSNIRSLCDAEGGETRTVRSDVFAFLSRQIETQSFRFIFADPPYQLVNDEQWIGRLFEKLERSQCLDFDGIFILEQSASTKVYEPDGWSVIRDKKYGDTRVIMYTVAH